MSQLIYKYKILSVALFIVSVISFYLGSSLIGIIALLIAVIMATGVFMSNKNKVVTTESTPYEQEKNLIKKQIYNLQFLPGVEKSGEKVWNQFQEIDSKYLSFNKILNIKFNSQELTHARYHTSVQNIYLGLFENFKKLVNLLSFLSSQTNKTLLEKSKNTSDPVEQQNIQKKIELYNQQEKIVSELININDEAITEIDKLNFSLNEIKSSSQNSETEMKDMIQQLQELSERAKKYSL